MHDYKIVKDLRAELRKQRQLELERVKGRFPNYVLYVVAVLICLLAYQMM